MKYDTVEVLGSKMTLEIARILKEEGYIAEYKEEKSSKGDKITLTLKYADNKKEKVITGLKRNFYYTTSIEAHVKELRKLQLKTNTTATTNNEDGYYFMEADNDLWMPIAMLSEKLTQNTLNEFMENFDKVNEFHVLDVKYKIKGDNNTHMETILYQNKRTACKDAIKFRKENEQCSTKFHTFINENCKEHKLTDFEILTAAIE